ncbi:hypothetical protein D3C72_2257790 [compost metagenome]
MDVDDIGVVLPGAGGGRTATQGGLDCGGCRKQIAGSGQLGGPAHEVLEFRVHGMALVREYQRMR